MSSGAQYVVAVYAVVLFALLMYVLVLGLRTARLARLVEREGAGAPEEQAGLRAEADAGAGVSRSPRSAGA